MPTAHPLFLYITFTVADPGGVEQRSLDIDVGRPLSPQPFAGSCRCMDGINRLQIPEDVIHDSYVQCGPYILIPSRSWPSFPFLSFKTIHFVGPVQVWKGLKEVTLLEKTPELIF